MLLKGFGSLDDVAREFEIWPGIFDTRKIHIAVYEDDYVGAQAFVLYTNLLTGQLYEVHASHCSCYGLEGQWDPEETSIESLMLRAERLLQQQKRNLFVRSLFEYALQSLENRLKGY